MSDASVPLAPLVSARLGWGLLGVFTVAMLAVTYGFARWRAWRTLEGFLVAERRTTWWLTGPSIAAAWIWAGALLVSTEIAYDQGLAGVFWFTLPNVLALAIFTVLGPRIRRRFDRGYTLPEYVHGRLASGRVHAVYLVPFFFGQLLAITFNAFAGGALVSLLTGIPLPVVMPVLVGIALVYTLVSGLEASIVTDFVQLLVIFAGIGAIVPPAVAAAGGLPAVAAGLSGLHGTTNVLDPGIALSFGVVTSVGLVSQTITGQQFWQRAFALRSGHIAGAFLLGALLFAVVPLGLSVLGFLAASGRAGPQLPPGTDPSLVGVLTVNRLLGTPTVVVFMLVLLCGLSSAMDSAMSAASALWTIDVVRHRERLRAAAAPAAPAAPAAAPSDGAHDPQDGGPADARMIRHSRAAMVGVSALGVALAYGAYFIAGFGVKQLFLVGIATSAAVSAPTVLSLYRDDLDERAVFWGIVAAVSVGFPLVVWGNWVRSDRAVAVASVLMIAVSGAPCLLWRRGRSGG